MFVIDSREERVIRAYHRHQAVGRCGTTWLTGVSMFCVRLWRPPSAHFKSSGWSQHTECSIKGKHVTRRRTIVMTSLSTLEVSGSLFNDDFSEQFGSGDVYTIAVDG